MWPTNRLRELSDRFRSAPTATEREAIRVRRAEVARRIRRLLPPEPTKYRATEALILRRIDRAGGEMRRDRVAVAFAGRASADDIDRLTDALADQGLIDVELIDTHRKCRGGFLARHRRTFYRITEEGREAVRMAELERTRKRPMTPRPPRPEPDNRTPAEKILDALRSAGGSSQRNNLRVALHTAIPTADFDRIIGELVARGQIVAELQLATWRSPRGNDIPYRVMVYTLSEGRPGQNPRPVEDPRGRGGRVPGLPITMAEAEARILAALHKAEKPRGRTALQDGIKPRLPLKLFNDALVSLIDRRLVTAKLTQTDGILIHGRRITQDFLVYRLTPAGKKAGQRKAD